MREQWRYRILEGVYLRTGSNCETTVSGAEVGDEIGLPREETYRIIHYLETRGYLSYMGVGPVVCITPKGVEYIERKAGRRRSIRDRGDPR